MVRGALDVLAPDEVARTWVGSISGARRTDIPDAGHCLALERPEVAAEVQGAPTCNGWDFWFVERKGQPVPIEFFRQQIRAEMGA